MAGKGDAAGCAANVIEALARLEACLAKFAAELDDDASGSGSAAAATG